MTAVRRTPTLVLLTPTAGSSVPAGAASSVAAPAADRQPAPAPTGRAAVLTLVHSATAARTEAPATERPSPVRTVLLPGTLLDFLRDRTTGLVAQAGLTPVAELDDLHDADVDAELMDRLQDIYRSALPERLSAISEHTSAGDAPAVASAANTLAGTSGQLGHPEVASICRAIAADARRGVLAHSRVQELQALAGA